MSRETLKYILDRLDDILTGGFLRYDDGTYTYEIAVGEDPAFPDLFHPSLILQVTLDADGSLIAQMYLGNDGFVALETTNGFEVNDVNAGGIFFEEHGGGGIFFNEDDGGGIFLSSDNGGGIFLDDVGSGGIFLQGLPTSAPGGSKQVWNDSGTLKITP